MVYELQPWPQAPQPTLSTIKRLPAPVYDIDYHDVTADGVRELLVLTAEAIHIFQVSLDIEDFYRYIQKDEAIRNLDVALS